MSLLPYRRRNLELELGAEIKNALNLPDADTLIDPALL